MKYKTILHTKFIFGKFFLRLTSRQGAFRRVLVKIVQKTFTQNIDSAGNVFVRANIFIEVDSDSVLQGLQRDDLADIVQNYKILQAENISMRNEIEHLKKISFGR